MRYGIGILMGVAITILVLCARVFDAVTVVFIGAAMLIVGVCAGAAVALGEFTRRRSDRRRVDDADAEIIHDHQGSRDG